MTKKTKTQNTKQATHDDIAAFEQISNYASIMFANYDDHERMVKIMNAHACSLAAVAVLNEQDRYDVIRMVSHWIDQNMAMAESGALTGRTDEEFKSEVN